VAELGKDYKPSAQGKAQVGVAAAIVGNGIYAASKYAKTKPAQTPAKIPARVNMPPRGATPSATSAYNFYSTRAKATVTAQSLENSFRMPSQAARGEGATGLVGAAQRVGRTAVGAGRWLIGGISASTAALTAVTTAGILGVSEGLLTQGTLTDTDELLALTRERYKQLGLKYLPEAREVQAGVYPFTGGQGSGVAYNFQITVNGQTRLMWTHPYGSNAELSGKITQIRFDGCGSPNFGNYNSNYWTVFNDSGSSTTLHIFIDLTSQCRQVATPVPIRRDAQPDTDGNPPATTSPIYSPSAGILMNLDGAAPTVGEVPSPPPALISQQGDPLYDAARVPLQWVMDGTPPPWARSENPVARLPGARIVPAAPAAPTDIPQPDVAPSPDKDDKPQNPYPFFDPVTFPETTTPNQFDIKPAFTPNPLVANPLSPNPLTPTTNAPLPTPSKTPASVPSTGTPFQPNPTTRNPEPAPQVQPQPKTEPAPEKSPAEKVLEQLPGIATGIALLTPIVRGIQDNTSPEKIIPLVKEGACQSLNGGCTNGVNIPSQLANNGTKLDAINTGLQAIDLSLLQTIDNKLGPQISGGGIGGFLQRAFQATRLDKILNALTLITTLHNAAMLSRNLGQTLGDLTGQALLVIGIKDENGSALDINAEIGRQVNNLMSTILGAETWAGTKENWNKANRIISSANQIMWTVRSIADSGREVTEWIANNTGKIGNALKRFRVVGENAYPHMAENVSHQNAWMLKVQRYREGVDTLDDAASSLQGVLGEVQNIQQEAQELTEQKQRFDASIKAAQPKTIPDNDPIKDKAAQPKTIPDNDPIKDKAAVMKTASLSPANTSEVFRGEGETDNA